VNFGGRVSPAGPDISIHEISQIDDLHFSLTEFIEGQTLRQQIPTATRQCGAGH
jgi:hypothetical protein